ncbi:glutathione S-transferase N-terminal domain-containing protein [Acinetobacter boissieri]|uniref:RNA polymerase-associated protein n=1 Tax=Acinetobacter boissieri TaxID=1219383 RepID=A0A1G6KA61_9GAMM|nr:glutathione S-transferase N-terminal domain-containing protein [Acinetobacter boissieri]SDC27475.1 RNA polymerase-associated protein [Acinetobacter boissieri]
MTLDISDNQSMTLLSHSDDFRSHWVRFMLAEKEIKHQLILTDYDDEDLISLSPYQNLPVLLDQGVKLFNTAIIAEYLDDRYRQNKLFTDNPIQRAEQRQYIWRFEKDWFQLADHMLRHADSLDPQKKQLAQKKLRDTLISLTPLFQHFPFFMSDHFSVLDCMIAPMLLRLEDMGVHLPPTQCRAIFLYQQKLFNRTGFVKAMTTQEKNRYSKHIVKR